MSVSYCGITVVVLFRFHVGEYRSIGLKMHGHEAIVWFIDIIRRGILTPYVELKFKMTELRYFRIWLDDVSNTIEFINRLWV